MTIQLSRAQFAIVVGLTLSVFTSGVVAGAAGSTMIIGSEANNAGAANTQLLTNSSVVAFKLLQNGPGTALMGYATPITGTTRGVYGRVDSPNGDGLQGRNAAPAGTGAAIRGYGGENAGAVLSSDADYPLELVGPVNVAPMTVNSSIKVANLNADQLDGKDWSTFDLDGPHYGYYTCAGATLVPTTGPGTYGTQNGRYATGAGNTFGCPVMLPEDAIITALRGYIYDTSATEEVSSCSLHFITVSNGVSYEVSTTPGSGVAYASGQRAIEEILLSIEVSNANFPFWAECTIAGTGTDISIIAIQVGYTIEGVPYQ